jgi:hypothetical protein
MLETVKELGLLCVALALGLAITSAQTDTNVFDATKALHFWAALQRTNAVRVGGFGDSVVDPYSGGKMAGFEPRLRTLLGKQSGGIVNSFPHLGFMTNGVGTYSGPDTNWWWNHHYLTNGSVVTFLCATPNGPSGINTDVWCDTVAAYYLKNPKTGSFVISIRTNGGAFDVVCPVDAAGPVAGAATNISLPLGYYQMSIACTNGTVTLIDGGMWNEHQPNLVLTSVGAPGMAYIDWTSIPTNITWPIFAAWKPDLLLLEAKDTPAWFRTSLPLLEQMFTNCAPDMDAIYIGTTAAGTNGYPTINQDITIPQNAVMAHFARKFGRQYWDSFNIISYERATALGWTRGDNIHFNYAGGTVLGDMLWSDMWCSFHRLDARVTESTVTLSWYATVGQTYQLQFTPTLQPADWQSLGAPITATNYTVKVEDIPIIVESLDRVTRNSGPTARFYRLLSQPDRRSAAGNPRNWERPAPHWQGGGSDPTLSN